MKRRIISSPAEPFFVQMQLAGDRVRARRDPELAQMHLEHDATRKCLRRLINQDSVCVDVGGHIGSMLSEFMRLAPRGTHTVVEADPSKVEWLQKRFPTVRVIAAAVSDSSGSVQFALDPARPGYSHIAEEHEDPSFQIVTVRCTTLDAELGDRQVDFMKIDVEGVELQCLRGARHILETHRPRLVVECGYYAGDLTQSPLVATYELLVDDLGYRLFLASDYAEGRPELTLEGFLAAHEFPFKGWNYVAVHRDDVLSR